MRKTARVSWANIARGILLALTLELPWPGTLGWLWEVVNWLSFVMVFGGAATLIVYGLVNAARTVRGDGAEESALGRVLREHREEEEALAASQEALARITLANQQADAFRAALEVALKAGTASLNGVPVRPGKTLVRSSAECDECGDPMDVAWGHGSGPRLCRPCRTHGMESYTPPSYPAITECACGRCGKRLLVHNAAPGATYLCAACDND